MSSHFRSYSRASCRTSRRFDIHSCTGGQSSSNWSPHTQISSGCKSTWLRGRSVMSCTGPRLNLLLVDAVSSFQSLFCMLLVGPDSRIVGWIGWLSLKVCWSLQLGIKPKHFLICERISYPVMDSKMDKSESGCDWSSGSGSLKGSIYVLTGGSHVDISARTLLINGLYAWCLSSMPHHNISHHFSEILRTVGHHILGWWRHKIFTAFLLGLHQSLVEM